MKKIITLILLFFSFGLIGQNDQLLTRIENKFMSLIKNERFRNNEGRFINEARKEFFSHFKIENNFSANLIEIFDPESPSQLYIGVISYNDMILFFEKGIKDGKIELGKIRKITKKEFWKHYPMLSCINYEMDKPEPNRIIGIRREGSYHFRLYLTKIYNPTNIRTYVPDDICIGIE